MPITLDPSKQFVEIKLFYIETMTARGPVYKFIQNAKEMEGYKTAGYRHEFEIKEIIRSQKPESKIEYDSSKVIYSITTKWRRMLWKDHNIIFSKCIKVIQNPDGTTSSQLDSILYRDMKIKQCLKEWDLKDDRGQVVKVTNDNIDSLTPDIAMEMLNAFERYTEATADELGE